MSEPESDLGLFELVDTPRIHEPTLVLALEGWIDAAGAAQGARNQLLDIGVGRCLARFNTDRLLDHRHRRPILRLVDDVASGLTWPTLELSLLNEITETEILLLHGVEPDHDWRSFAAAVTDLCVQFGVTLVIGLGAYPAAVPHTRPTRLSCTAGTAEMKTRLEVITASAEVPAGVQAVVEQMTTAAQIPTIGL